MKLLSKYHFTSKCLYSQHIFSYNDDDSCRYFFCENKLIHIKDSCILCSKLWNFCLNSVNLLTDLSPELSLNYLFSLFDLASSHT